MSIYNAWAICDRCGWRYQHYQMTHELGTESFVCPTCDDGEGSLVAHPQLKTPYLWEDIAVPDARPDTNLAVNPTIDHLGWPVIGMFQIAVISSLGSTF